MDTDRPTTRSFAVRPFRVAVEVEPGAREFVIDPRLSVESLDLGADLSVHRAEVACWAGRLREDLGEEDALDVGTVLNGGRRDGFGTFLSPEQEIFIVRERPEGAAEAASKPWEPILSGYCLTPEYREQSSGGKTTRQFHFRVDGVLDRLSDQHYTQIVGRTMRGAGAAADLAEKAAGEEFNADAPLHDETLCGTVDALPCVFNAGGRPNCSATPIEATLGDRTRWVYVFTHDSDPDAVEWTWARVLRYLWYFYASPTPATAPSEALIRDGDLFDQTSPWIYAHVARPAAPVDADDAMQFALLGKPNAFSCDGMNVAEAIGMVCEEAGLRFRIVTEVEDGEPYVPVNKLYLGPRGAGERVTIAHESVPDETDDRTALERNECQSLVLRVDYRDVQKFPVIVGDVRRYEITAELVPGWEPDENLDDVAAEDFDTKLDAANAHVDLALEGSELTSDAWYRKYHRQGAEHRSYRAVGRRWVLNTSGKYLPADYARETGPFGEDAYATFQPGDCGITDSVINADGQRVDLSVSAWVPRERPFLPCFSADAEGRSLGVYVEVSFDEGSTWHHIPALAPRALDDAAAIHFEADDLVLIFPPGGTWQTTPHFWQAIMAGDARVRVTCVIEGDLRLTPTLDRDIFGSPVAAGRLFEVPGRFKSNRQDGGNSQFAGTSPTIPQARDNVTDIQAFAESLLDVCSSRQQAGLIVIPWITTDYRLGQSVESVRGQGLAFLSHAAAARRWPDIVGVHYAPGATTISLDDTRLRDELDLDASGSAGREGT